MITAEARFTMVIFDIPDGERAYPWEFGYKKPGIAGSRSKLCPIYNFGMENKYLVTHIIKFFQKIEFDKGHLFHIESDLNHYYKNEVPRIQKILEDKIGEDANKAVYKFSGLTISDISGATKNGALFYYPLPTEAYIVNHVNYRDKINEILIYVRNMLLSQSYDALETFIKDATIEYCKYNEPSVLSAANSMDIKKSQDKIDWHETIRGIRSKKYNDLLLSLVRNLNPTFKMAELNNTKDIDLKIWYEMFSEVRHSIVHSQSIVPKDKYNGLKKEGQKHLKDFISTYKNKEGNYVLKTTHNELNEMIKVICEYAFQIFKGYSIQSGSEWKILLHMKNNET